MSQFFIDLKNLKYKTVRFDPAIFMDYSDNFDPLTSYFLEAVIKLPQAGKYIVTREAGRPDQLSHTIYSDTQYWWVLMHYNGILSADDIKIGDTIRYPSINEVERLYFSLKSKESSQ